MENFRVDAPWSAPAADPVSPLNPAADPLRAPQKMQIATGDFPLPFVSLKDEIEELGSSPEPGKIGQDGIFTADSDVEAVLVQDRKRPDGACELEPIREFSFRRKQDEGVAEFGELVADLQVAADSSINLDVRKKRRNLHFRLNVARTPFSVKLSIFISQALTFSEGKNILIAA